MKNHIWVVYEKCFPGSHWGEVSMNGIRLSINVSKTREQARQHIRYLKSHQWPMDGVSAPIKFYEADDWDIMECEFGSKFSKRGELPELIWILSYTENLNFSYWFFCKEDAENFHSWNDKNYTEPKPYVWKG